MVICVARANVYFCLPKKKPKVKPIFASRRCQFNDICWVGVVQTDLGGNELFQYLITNSVILRVFLSIHAMTYCINPPQHQKETHVMAVALSELTRLLGLLINPCCRHLLRLIFLCSTSTLSGYQLQKERKIGIDEYLV